MLYLSGSEIRARRHKLFAACDGWWVGRDSRKNLEQTFWLSNWKLKREIWVENLGEAFFEWTTEMKEKSLLMPLIVNLLECRSFECLWQASQKAEWGMWWPITRNVRFRFTWRDCELMGDQKQRACVGNHVSAELHVTSNRDMCLQTKAELSIFKDLSGGIP